MDIPNSYYGLCDKMKYDFGRIRVKPTDPECVIDDTKIDDVWRVWVWNETMDNWTEVDYHKEDFLGIECDEDGRIAE